MGKKEGWRRGKNGIGPRMKNGHANYKRKNALIKSCFVGRLSKKKQTLTTVDVKMVLQQL